MCHQADPDQASRVVRALLHRLGYRFRLARADLPGCPDLVLPRWRMALFVVDCGAYRHPDCRRPPAAPLKPVPRPDGRRLEQACDALGQLGWETVVVCACEADDRVALGYRLDIAIQAKLVAARE